PAGTGHAADQRLYCPSSFVTTRNSDWACSMCPPSKMVVAWISSADAQERLEMVDTEWELDRGASAVGGQNRTSDIAGPVRGQKGDNFSDLCGLAGPSQRVGGAE